VQTKASNIGAALMRIENDYLEMPDLELTVEEAAKLWNMDPLKCLTLLEVLVDGGFLARSDAGGYMRADVGDFAVLARPMRAARPN